MSIKKLCSIGLLNIKLTLTLRKSFAENNNFNIDNYNSSEDLSKLFPPKISSNSENIKKENYIDYMDYISLSSDDNLLNTLFYINRAYKTKTFIEFLIPNEIKYNEKNYFLKNLINEILNRNYFFVVENNIINESSTIKFIIKILNDEKEEIISIKELNLIEKNNEEKDIFDNEYFESYKLNYDFRNNNFFLIDLDSLKTLKWRKYTDMISFIVNVIKDNNLKIILSINENSLNTNIYLNHSRNNKEVSDILKMNKIIIELSDIIFCFKKSINNFLKKYSAITRVKMINNEIKYRLNSPTIANNNFLSKIYANSDSYLRKNQDLIIYDKNKYRKNIPRLSVILDDFDYLTIYNQEFEDLDTIDMNIEPFCENFCFSLLDKNHTNKDFRNIKKIIANNSERCFHVFIGGFLSRYINNADINGGLKNYEECFIAGNLILKNYLILLKYNIDYITDVDEYNVFVPKVKKCLKEILYKERKEELRKIRKKEKKFILDCINASKSQKKEYNSLLDFNCTSFISKNNNILNQLTNNNNKVIPNKKIGSFKKINLFSEKKNSININLINRDRLNYYNKYNSIGKINSNFTPLILNNKNKIVHSNNNKDNKIMFKRILESKPNNININESNNNCNNSPKNNFIKTSTNFLTQNKTFDNNYNKNYSNNININIIKDNKKLKIKIPSLNLKKRRYESNKKEKRVITNRKNFDLSDSSSNANENNYIEYLFKLYQPKNKFKNFLNSLSNIKKSKK